MFSIYASASLTTEVGFPKLDAADKDAGELDVSGDVVDYRDGNEAIGSPRILPHDSDLSDVTLKRGLVDTSSLSGWLSEVRNSSPAPQNGAALQSWTLHEAEPQRYEGPPLNSKKEADTAMEELVLSLQRIQIKP